MQLTTNVFGFGSRLVLLALLTACAPGDPEELGISESAPPPAAAFTPARGMASLDSTLATLEKELTAAIENEGELDERTNVAEAITDRLLETQLPFAWLTGRSYGVEPVLRQIQSLADRVRAEIRNEAPLDNIKRDLVTLRTKVTDLRAALRGGGGNVPLSLDSLLAAYAADSLLKIVDTGE